MSIGNALKSVPIIGAVGLSGYAIGTVSDDLVEAIPEVAGLIPNTSDFFETLKEIGIIIIIAIVAASALPAFMKVIQ